MNFSNVLGLVILLILAGAGCSSVSTDTGDTSEDNQGRDTTTVGPLGTGFCGTMEEGGVEERERYAESVVPYGEECLVEIQTRTCHEAAWTDWTGTYQNNSCRVGGPMPCGEHPHGTEQSRVRYERTSVGYNEECLEELQTRICDNAAWSTWSGTFIEEYCVVDYPENCGGIPHGGTETRMMYEVAAVPSGENCREEIQSRVCEDGDWGVWSGSFSFESCQVEGKASCGQTPHGGSEVRTRYEEPSVVFGNTCAEEVQTRTCDDGSLSAWSGSFVFESCSVRAAVDCDGTPHGTSEARVMYQAETVPYGESCVQEAQSRTCDNGSWAPWSGTFPHEACSVETAADCDGTPHGGSVTRTMYQTASVPHGQTCLEEVQTRGCFDGTWGGWSGTYSYASCSEGAAASCGDTPHGGTETRVRFESESVPSGESCVSENQTRTCNDGVWGAWSGSYNFTTCTLEEELAFCQEACDYDVDCFYMGLELGIICEDNRCVADSCHSDADCTTAPQTHCELSTGECICDDASCGPGLQCLPEGYCGCADDSACSLLTFSPSCNTATGSCECTDTSCGPGFQCMPSGVCGCATDAACASMLSQPVCNSATGRCECDAASCGEGTQCRVDGYCGCATDSFCDSIFTGFVCDISVGLCACDDDEDCLARGGDLCINGICGCSSADACTTEPFFDGTSMVCEPI